MNATMNNDRASVNEQASGRARHLKMECKYRKSIRQWRAMRQLSEGSIGSAVHCGQCRRAACNSLRRTQALTSRSRSCRERSRTQLNSEQTGGKRSPTRPADRRLRLHDNWRARIRGAARRGVGRRECDLSPSRPAAKYSYSYAKKRDQ